MDIISNQANYHVLVADIISRIQECLSNSVILTPLHIEVSDQSFWYNMRRKLGIRKHSAVIYEQNSTSGRWESYIYKLRPRDEDLQIMPQKSFLTSHPTRWSAYKHCEAALEERDSAATNPGQIFLFAGEQTAFLRITVVSEVFDRKAHLDRLVIVYRELLTGLGKNILPPNDSNPPGFSRCAPSQMTHLSTFGRDVCGLPLFRFLLFDVPVVFSVDAKTPSQWEKMRYQPPVSERYGSAHTGITASRINPTAQPLASRKRLKMLAKVGSPATTSFSPSTKSPSPPKMRSVSADQLGISTTQIPGQKWNGGGFYGHFFEDLQAPLKSLIMDEHTRNKKLIQREGFLRQDRTKRNNQSGRPKTTLDALRSTTSGANGLSEYDKGTHSEHEMVEEVYIRARNIERICIRIQRIWRRKVITFIFLSLFFILLPFRPILTHILNIYYEHILF